MFKQKWVWVMRVFIFLTIHAIGKKLKTPVSILAKDSSRSKELFANDEHIDEIIGRKDLDGVKGFFNLLKIIKAKNFDKILSLMDRLGIDC